MEYNFHDLNSPHNNNNNQNNNSAANNSLIEKDNLTQQHQLQNNYSHQRANNENIAYNIQYDPNTFNNPSNIYKKPSKNSRIGNISNNTGGEEDYIQSNVKSFNSKNINNNFQNMNYSNISNQEYQNVNYSGDEMGTYEVLEHQHENYHNRSPDSLLRYNNNSNSQSPENHLQYQPDIRNDHNALSHNSMTNNKNKRINQGRERERSPPDNSHDHYLKK